MNTEKMDLLKEKREASFYVEKAHEDASWIPFLIETLENPTAIKYMAEKTLRVLSIEYPKDLFPYTDILFPYLKSDNHFIKWGLIITLANLLEKEGLWDRIKEEYYSFLDSKELVEFGNTVSTLDKVIQKNQEEETYFVSLLCKTDTHTFLHKGEVSKECQNVAIGHVLDFFTKIYSNSLYQKEIENFTKRQVNNPKESTRKKAVSLLKKIEKGQ